MPKGQPGSRKPGTFQPGNQTGINGGKRTTRFITQQLIMQLQEEISNPLVDPKSRKPEDVRRLKERATRVHWLVKRMIDLAIAGDTTCMRMIMDRVEGTPMQTVSFQHEDREQPAVVPADMTEEALRKLPSNELSRLVTASILAEQPVLGSA